LPAFESISIDPSTVRSTSSACGGILSMETVSVCLIGIDSGVLLRDGERTLHFLQVFPGRPFVFLVAQQRRRERPTIPQRLTVWLHFAVNRRFRAEKMRELGFRLVSGGRICRQ
jgi:hypothetical protein